MIRFTIRVLAYGLLLAIAISLSPGMSIQPLVPGVVDVSATYLLFGIFLGVINTLVRPLVLLFTAKLLLRTVGLFSIVINTLMLGSAGLACGRCLRHRFATVAVAHPGRRDSDPGLDDFGSASRL